MPTTDSSEVSTDELILEGIVVSCDETGATNIAPMGPRVDRQLTRFVLRPFQTAQTYQNVKATGHCVFHVTDDVLLLARAAVGQLEIPPKLARIDGFDCPRLADACRWFALRAESIDDAAERATIVCQVVQHGEVRPFFGFNRAKHAVLEAAILATRIGILAAEEIDREMERLAIPVQKTAGEQERQAFQLLRDYVTARLMKK
ncbi:MAG TPA: DUF447 domain-containing protein [Pirellulaceae bacterium]|jgi:hypothetical protein